MKITLELVKAAGIRALKTIAQTIVASIVVGQTIVEVNWLNIASIAFVAGLVSFLQNILVGLPEVVESNSISGTMIVDDITDEDSKSYRWVLEEDLDVLGDKKEFTIKVEHAVITSQE